ncbi:MAG: hypothetical protein ACYSTR_05310, partial [Planctomycetota bacterium]
ASPIYAYFNTLKISNDTLKNSNDALKIRLERLEKKQQQIYQSNSWRITAPLRKMKSIIRKLKS